MAMAPRPVVFLGKAEYMDAWQTKFIFPAVGMVPIKRDVKKASMAALTTAAELLADGNSSASIRRAHAPVTGCCTGATAGSPTWR